MTRILLLGGIFFWLFNSLTGQTQPAPAPLLISADYQKTPFPEVVADLEARYPLRFFFEAAWTDSLVLTLQATNQGLETFLAQLFRETNLSAVATPQGEVILTKGVTIEALKVLPFYSGAQPETDEEGDVSLFQRDNGELDETDPNAIEKILFPIGDPKKRGEGTLATVVGYLRDDQSGEPIVGASVFKKDPVKGTLTDAFGYYVLTIPKGEHVLYYRASGMGETQRRILLHSDGQLDVALKEKIVSLKEVQITSERSQVESVQTGIAKLSTEAIKTTPTVLGEADVMKLVLTLPGVQSVGEGASGFNVRGGGTDQNLITIDDGVIYNPSHLFGFFSAFNADVIKSADLFKSGLQAQYGGRVSSIFDISTRDGNQKKFQAAGGISPLTSRITVEGPLKQDTSSYILGLRSTYSNYLLGLLDDPTLNNSDARFADAIGKVSHQFDNKNSASLTFYHSRDRFSLNGDTVFQYFNTNATLRFRHLFSNTFSSLFSASFTDYNYEINSDASPTNAFTIGYGIRQYSLKADFDYFPRPQHHVRFGWQGINYHLSPGSILPTNPETVFSPVNLPQEVGLENAIYLGDEWELGSRLSLYGGLRFSLFNRLGPTDVYGYTEGQAREPEFITDTTAYDKGQLVKTYAGPELRLSGRYKLGPELSLKFSYDRTRQYIHLLTNSVAISPTDTWRLSSTYIQPQIGDQLALGLYQNIPRLGLEISLEPYFKWLQNILEYKEGADLLVNEVLETDVINANGINYGLEFLFRKKSGKLTGWLSYTWSRAWVQTQSPYASEQINDGNYYPSNFDQPHKLVVISNYKFNRRLNLSLNLTYNTGRPTTLPITRYVINGTVIPFFTERNQYRIPDYFRIDLGINVEGNHKVHKLVHSSASFSIYNLTGRNNAYSVFSRVEDGTIRTYQLSIFSQAIPTLTYTFTFR